MELVPFASVTAADIRKCGEQDRERCAAGTAHAGPMTDDTLVYRIEFHVVGDACVDLHRRRFGRECGELFDELAGRRDAEVRCAARRRRPSAPRTRAAAGLPRRGARECRRQPGSVRERRTCSRLTAMASSIVSALATTGPSRSITTARCALDLGLDALERGPHAVAVGLAARPAEQRPVDAQRAASSASSNDSVTSVPSPARLEPVAPHVQRRLPGLPTPNANSRPGSHVGDGARRPVDRAHAVALHVPAEAGADGRAGRAVEPLGLERLGAVAADLGDVADEIPDLLGRCGRGGCHAHRACIEDCQRQRTPRRAPLCVADEGGCNTGVLSKCAWCRVAAVPCLLFVASVSPGSAAKLARRVLNAD